MLEWIVVSVAGAAAAGFWWSRRPRRRRRLDDGTSPVAREHRHRSPHATVTVRIEEPEAARTTIEASSDRIPALDDDRIYVAWDVERTSATTEHWTRLDFRPRGAPGTFEVRTESDAARVEAWLQAIVVSLIDARRTADARSLQLTVAAGYATLRLQEAEPRAKSVEQAKAALVAAIGALTQK